MTKIGRYDPSDPFGTDEDEDDENQNPDDVQQVLPEAPAPGQLVGEAPRPSLFEEFGPITPEQANQGLPPPIAPGYEPLEAPAPVVGGLPADAPLAGFAPSTLAQAEQGLPPAPAPVRLAANGQPWDEVNGGSDGIPGYSGGTGWLPQGGFDWSSRNTNTLTGKARYDSLFRRSEDGSSGDPPIEHYSGQYRPNDTFQSFYQRVKAGTDNNSLISGYSATLPDRIRAAYEQATGKPVSSRDVYGATIGGTDPTFDATLAAVPPQPGENPSAYWDRVQAATQNGQLGSGYNATRTLRGDLLMGHLREQGAAGLEAPAPGSTGGTGGTGAAPAPGAPVPTGSSAPRTTDGRERRTLALPNGNTFTGELSAAEEAALKADLDAIAAWTRQIQEQGHQLQVGRLDLDRSIAAANAAYQDALVKGKDRELAQQAANFAMSIELQRQDQALRASQQAQTVSLERERLDEQRRARRPGRGQQIRYR